MKIKMVEWFDEHWYKITLDDDTEKYLPSTTTKLQAMPKPFLARWRGNIGNREADLRLREASMKGIRIHYSASVISSGGVVVYNPFNHPNYNQEEIAKLREENKEVYILEDQDEMWQVAKFNQWLDIVKPEIVAIEKIVYDIDNNEAGTVDYIFKIEEGFYDIAGSKTLPLEGGYYVADLKSSNELRDSHYLQVADYVKICEKNVINENEIRGGLLIHTNATKIKKGIPGLNTKLLTMKEINEDYYHTYRNVAAIWEKYNQNAHPRMLEFPALIKREVSVESKNH